jgi:hypothetical protein
MQNFNTFSRDDIAWQTWQEITNRQFRALLLGIEPRPPASLRHSHLPGGFP